MRSISKSQLAISILKARREELKLVRVGMNNVAVDRTPTAGARYLNIIDYDYYEQKRMKELDKQIEIIEWKITNAKQD